jgi:hypothetical protein
MTKYSKRKKNQVVFCNYVWLTVNELGFGWLAEGTIGWVWYVKLLNSFDGKILVDDSNEANGSKTSGDGDWVDVGQSEGWTLDK